MSVISAVVAYAPLRCRLQQATLREPAPSPRVFITTPPTPHLTSKNQSASIPSASFLLIMLAGDQRESMERSRSHRATHTSFRSAGAISSVVPVITQPTLLGQAAASSLRVRSVRKPLIDSSLSSVPPGDPQASTRNHRHTYSSQQANRGAKTE